MRYRVQHHTKYEGNEPVSVGHNQAWLRPRNLPYQNCLQFLLKISPEPSMISTRLDFFGNTVSIFSFNRGYDSLEVLAESEVSVSPRLEQETETPSWKSISDLLGPWAGPEFCEVSQFCFASPFVPIRDELGEYARISFLDRRPILEAALDLIMRIHREFVFDSEATTISTPVMEVFQRKRGVCQDFAHLTLSMLRSLGLAARYVSGYIRTYSKDGEPRLTGADASHAWVSLFAGPEVGWIDLDPTNRLLVGEEHISVAWGRDYGDVPPLCGVFTGGGQLRLHVEVTVEPLTPRKPEL